MKDKRTMFEMTNILVYSNSTHTFHSVNEKDAFGLILRGSHQEVLKVPQLAFRYALYVLKSPWPVAEKIISTCPKHSSLYAHQIIKGRFELGETMISTDSVASHYYAMNAIKERFYLGEPVVINSFISYSYCMYFNLREENGVFVPCE